MISVNYVRVIVCQRSLVVIRISFGATTEAKILYSCGNTTALSKLWVNIPGAAAFRDIAGHIFEITNFTTAGTFFGGLWGLNGSAALPALPMWIIILLLGLSTGRISAMATNFLYFAVIFATFFTNTRFNLSHSLRLIF